MKLFWAKTPPEEAVGMVGAEVGALFRGTGSPDAIGTGASRNTLMRLSTMGEVIYPR